MPKPKMNAKEAKAAIFQLVKQADEPLSAEQAAELQQGIRKMLQELVDLNESGDLRGIVLLVNSTPDEDGNNMLQASLGYAPVIARLTVAMPAFYMRITKQLLDKVAPVAAAKWDA